MRASDSIIVAIDDGRSPEMEALVAAHVAFSADATPDNTHSLAIDALREPGVTLWAAREGERLAGCGALKQLEPGHAELKSMHTAATHRGRGVARLVLGAILDHARAAGMTRISLETGATEPFAPARRLYERAGFKPCGPFGDYDGHPTSAFYTLQLTVKGT